MEPPRLLMVVADDYGFGPQTSKAILELARDGVLTGTVLMTNSPYAEDAVKSWRCVGPAADLGWHPTLTADGPVAPPGEVSSLLGPNGEMWPLKWFLLRLLLRQIRPEHIYRELQAQLKRFIDITGRLPLLVNSHQHAALFGPVGKILRDVLRPLPVRPYMRRITEPWASFFRVPGARIKRGLLEMLGKGEAARQAREGFPGPEWLAGITDPAWVRQSGFFARWLSSIPGRVVELMCHPGYFDPTLVGRDCRANDGLQQRRVDELALLRQPAFLEACRAAGFTLCPPSDLAAWTRRRNVA